MKILNHNLFAEFKAYNIICISLTIIRYEPAALPGYVIFLKLIIVKCMGSIIH